MQFCDKLDFLMKISNTANKELAQGIAVDRSLVSLLRTGRRPRPRNLDHIHRIARFLAPRITTDFQRHAVADMLGQISIRSSLPTDMLVDALEKWLIGDQDMVDHFVDSLTAPPAPTTPPLPQPQQSVSRDTRFFFGNEGRREAMRYMASMLNGLKDPCDILVASDGNMDWLLEDYDFSCEMRDGLVTAMDREITLYQILPSMNFINSYIESLRFWLPMYTSGRARVFYYPRLRDNLYRHSTIIVPGHAVNSVSGIGLQSTTQVSMVSGQPELINAYSALFQNHLALCRPAMELHSSMSEYAACYRDYFSRDGAIIQQVSPLPITTMPPELMRYYQDQSDSPFWKGIFQDFLDLLPTLHTRMKGRSYIDIARLASVRDIRAGTVPVVSPMQTRPDQPFYTPETYAQHLKYILYTMETNENYWFIPYHGERRNDFNLFVNESGPVLIVRLAPPTLMLELHRPEMVQAFREYLLRIVDKDGFDSTRRKKIVMELSALIRELQS